MQCIACALLLPSLNPCCVLLKYFCSTPASIIFLSLLAWILYSVGSSDIGLLFSCRSVFHFLYIEASSAFVGSSGTFPEFHQLFIRFLMPSVSPSSSMIAFMIPAVFPSTPGASLFYSCLWFLLFLGMSAMLYSGLYLFMLSVLWWSNYVGTLIGIL